MKDFKKTTIYDESIKTSISNSSTPLLGLGVVSCSVAQQYAEFCVRCDRENLPLIKIEDYLTVLK